jgi:hypothetical protein
MPNVGFWRFGLFRNVFGDHTYETPVALEALNVVVVFQQA